LAGEYEHAVSGASPRSRRLPQDRHAVDVGIIRVEHMQSGRFDRQRLEGFGAVGRLPTS